MSIKGVDKIRLIYLYIGVANMIALDAVYSGILQLVCALILYKNPFSINYINLSQQRR